MPANRGSWESYALQFGQTSKNSDFARRITRMLHSNILSKSKATYNAGFSILLMFVSDLPKLISDMQTRLDQLAKDPSGITNPFESIYRIVYQLTMRTVGCDDIANNPELLERTLHLCETIKDSATLGTVLYPWFPSLALIKRKIAGVRFYMIIRKIVEERKRTGKRVDDPLQFLIDQEDDMTEIIQVRRLLV